MLRNLGKKPIYTTITFVGFTIGIIASLLIYLWVYNEMSCEKFHKDYQRIYRVLTLSKQGNEVVKSAGCYRPVAKTLMTDYPQIENATYISFDSEESPLQKESGREKIEALGSWTDNNFFHIFQGFKFIEGSSAEAFAKPSSIVLSEKVARKLFGNQLALGKVIISDKYFKDVYTVSGVVSISRESHIDFGFILSEKDSRFPLLINSWSNKNFVHVYIKLKKNAQIDNQFISQISNHISRYSNLTDKLMFQPLTDIHLYTDYEANLFDKNIGSHKYVWIFSGLAFLVVLMSCLNFSVLSVARASERSMEIGIKKINGEGRFRLFFQFMAESELQTFAATILALVIIWLILPWYNKLSGQQISFYMSFIFLGNIFLLTFVVGILAGIYPSFYFSSFSPMVIFRNGKATGSKTGFIRSIVVVQFSITIFLIIATSIFIKQLNYIHTKNLGFDDKNIVVIPTGLWYDNKEFKEELLKNPNVFSVSASSYAPIDFNWQINLALIHQGRSDSLKVTLFGADEDFAKSYKLEIVKGQFLNMDGNHYWEELNKRRENQTEKKDYSVTLPVVINETAEKKMGLDNPIGQRIGDYVIVGVVKDFNFQLLQHHIEPLIMTNDPENIMTMNVRISPVNQSETLNYIRDVYSKYRNSRDFSYHFFDELLAEKYQVETRLRNLTLIFSILAIIISMLGILGMAYFFCDRRTKEVSIRKVNGAKTWELMIMLNKDIIKWVAIAFIIACPIAWYTMHKWLQNFAYKTELSLLVFIATGIGTMAVALLTVSWLSLRTAKRNPVETLKYE